MKSNPVKYAIGLFVFLISAVQFILTAQVSVPFWDPGELSAAAYLMQVPHPPGGPLFSFIGRIFYLLPIPGDVGYRMNMVSGMSSAFIVLLLYLIIIKVIENYKGKQTGKSLESVVTYASAAIGALALSFCDTFWFNGGESNYFAASTLLYTLILWLLLIWNEKADEPGSDRYLLMIIYIAGLSAGLHLMSVLTILIVGITVVVRRYIKDEKQYLESLYVFLGHMVFLLFIAAIIWSGEKATQPPTPEAYGAFDKKFALIMLGASLVVFAVFRKKVFNKNSFYLAVIVGGVALAVVFPGIIRYLPELLLKIAGNSLWTGLVVLLLMMMAGGIAAYWSLKNHKSLIALSITGIMLAIVGFTTYTMIVIRANDNLPMNENHPKSFEQLVTYLNREQYGDFPMFKRRWSSEPEKAGIYTKYSSDLDFFLRYQMGHMFNRYLAWNFIGREAYEQDAGVRWGAFLGIPFLLGLFGLYYHMRKDWKMASILLFAFILMGYLIAYYQNQQEPQPRDREYFYCGAYLIFALWIGLGMRGLFDLLREKIPSQNNVKLTSILLIFAGLCVPAKMCITNYYYNNRSKNWVPWDFAYNMLQTCEQDAVLFTQGDNDTFPLWYMQDVEGVRRDVRVVNLSLANTSWYILQMKGTPAYPEAKPVPMRLPDSFIQTIQPIQWEPKLVSIPVSKETISQYQIENGIKLEDTSIINRGKLVFFLNNTLQFGQTKALRVQDIIVYDIILANNWKRPIYFASTCGPDAKIGLDQYLWFKGLAWKLEPVKVTSMNFGVDPVVLEKNLLHQPEGFSKTQQYGYKFRELNNPDVFFDENTSRIVTNYRAAFRALAMYYTNIEKNTAKSVSLFDRMEKLMPESKIPLGWQYAWELAGFYNAVGREERVKELGMEIEHECLDLIDRGEVNMKSYYNPYTALIDVYSMTKENDKLLGILNKLSLLYPNDQGIKRKIAEIETLKKEQDTAGKK